MKVLVVGTGGALAGSGITTAADQMVRTLARMGHEPVRLVAGANPRKRPNRMNLENVVSVLIETTSVVRTARATRPDVVWLHTMGVPTLPAVRVLAQVLAVRAVRRTIIVEFHAFGLADQVARSGWLERSVLRMIGRLSRKVVALQLKDADALRLTVPIREVAILHNWVEVPVEPPPLPPGPPFTAVFVGGLVARKGVPQLIEAMRFLDDVPVRLRLVGGAGDEGEQAAAELRCAASDLVRRGRVEFAGQLNGAGVRAALAGAHLFVLPSRAEGTPMAMLEALAAGRPVLVSDAGNMAEIVHSAGCGSVLPSQEPAVIADALRRALADRPLLVEQGHRAHEAAAEWFSERAAVESVSAILGT